MSPSRTAVARLARHEMGCDPRGTLHDKFARAVSFSSMAMYFAPSGSMNSLTAHPVTVTTQRISSLDTNSKSNHGPLRFR